MKTYNMIKYYTHVHRVSGMAQFSFLCQDIVCIVVVGFLFKDIMSVVCVLIALDAQKQTHAHRDKILEMLSALQCKCLQASLYFYLITLDNFLFTVSASNAYVRALERRQDICIRHTLIAKRKLLDPDRTRKLPTRSKIQGCHMTCVWLRNHVSHGDNIRI